MHEPPPITTRKPKDAAKAYRLRRLPLRLIRRFHRSILHDILSFLQETRRRILQL